jgi:beta-1,2-mannosidase
MSDQPSWAMLPFEKHGEPVLEPSAENTFWCPIARHPVRWESQNTYNPAAIVRDGRVHLLYRADDSPRSEGWGRTCRTGLAWSEDGRKFIRRSTPVIYPDDDACRQYEWEGGCEDIHVAQDEAGRYHASYTAWNGKVDAMLMASSDDLVTWRKTGPAFARAQNGSLVKRSRTGAIVVRRDGDRLLAARVGERYLMYWGIGCFVATSEDLVDWSPVVDEEGRPVSAVQPRPGRFDSEACEVGAVALLTDQGILLMYNAMNQRPDLGGDPSMPVGWSSLGQALLDPEQPTRLIDRLDRPFLQVDLEWERVGFYPNTLVANGLVRCHEEWLLYYGGADRRIGLASLRG